MVTIFAAALAAAAPAAAAQPADAHAQHAQQRQPAEHKGMDCKKCCEEMKAKMHEGQSDGRGNHSAHQQ